MQHHRLAVCAPLELGKCACRMFQRKWGTHRNPDCPGAEQFGEPCQPRPVGGHIDLLDFDAALGVRGVGGNRREPSAVPYRRERAGRAAGGGVNGQIGAAAYCELADLAWPVRRPAVQDVRGTGGRDPGSAARPGNHLGAQVHGQLDDQRPGDTARAIDQQDSAGPGTDPSRSAWSAVSAGTGTAAATPNGTASGTAATSAAAATNHCAHAPWTQSGSE